jgi:hypothetical protein
MVSKIHLKTKDLRLLGGITLMKNLFKVLTLGLFLTLFTVGNVATTYAQDDQAEKEALYNKYLANYDKSTIDNKQIAIAAAEEYIQKYNKPEDKQIVDYMQGAIPTLKEWIAKEKIRLEKLEKQKEAAARNNRFDAAVKAKNWDETFAAGADILKYNPDFFDISLVMASIGFDEASKATPNDKFNNEAVKYAQHSIDKMNAGVASTTGKFGAYAYEYENKDFADGKSNALGWMHYTIAYIKYFRQNKEQEALDHFYQASKYDSATQKFPENYRAVGRWYLNKVVEMEKVRTDKVTANNNEDNEETIALLAKNKGYAARAIDAYARAYKLVKDNPKTPQEYKDNIFARLKQLYDFRYDADEAAMKTEAKINSDVAVIMNKPMPNPSSTVQPIEKPKPETDSTETTDAATTTNGAKRARTVANKPR